jgi:pimeloyl-ACP methyl ester carboxylesterase
LARPTDRFVDLGALRARYLERGVGQPVILLHGAALGASAEAWESMLDPLARRGLRLLAPDWPGFGLTPSTTTSRKDHLLRFMDALGIEKGILVGHSMQLAFTHPDRVARLIVIATGSLLPPLPDRPRTIPQDPDSEPTLEDTREDLESNSFDHSLLTPEMIRRRHELSLGPNFRAALDRKLGPGESIAGAPLWQRLDSVPVPAMFIYGRQDRDFVDERAELARQRYPNLNLHVLDRCKHHVQWDRPDELTSLVAGFVLAGA